MSDDGTGKTDGTALDTAKWTTEGTTAGGGTATYQSSALKFQSGNQGGYAGTSRTSRSFNITSPADVEITGTFAHDANEAYPLVMARATTSTVDYNNGYYLKLGKDSVIRIGKTVSFAGTTLGSGSITPASNTTYGFRFRVVGTSLKARIWTGTEPSTWDIDITDSTFTSAGKAGITIGAGNAAVNHAVTFDNIVVTNGTTDVSLTETTTLADALSVTAAVPMTETASITDGTLTIAVPKALSETSTLTDGTLAVAAAVPLADTGTLADVLSVQRTLTMSDTGSLADALAVTAQAPFSDVGTLADDLTVESFFLRHDLKTEIEFTPGVWTDVSAYVVAESESTGTFGRPTRYDDVGASTWQTTLRNSGGEFTPTNINSAFYPNVAKGRGFRTSLTYSGQDYPLFWGRITGITLPAVSDIANCIVVIQAADVMADLARKTLLSPFVEESRRQATIHTAGCDVFPFSPSQVATDTTSIAVASTTFENKGIVFTGGTKLGTMYAMASANGAGAVKSAAQDTDGALIEGQLTFEIGDNGFGKQTHPVLVVKPQVGFQQAEFFFKLPKDVRIPTYTTGTHTVTSGQSWATIRDLYGMTYNQLRDINDGTLGALAVGQVVNIQANTNASEWILAHFWAGSTEVFRLVLGNFQDTVCLAVKKPDNSAQYILNSINLADEKWRKVTLFKTGTNKIRINVNDSTFGAEQTFSTDITSIDTVYLGGRVTPGQTGQQVQCPPVSLSGVAFQQAVCGVWYWYCLGAPPANITARDRLLELAAYASPVALAVDVQGDLTSKVVRTATTGRSVLECLQELARTVLGYLWVDPATGTLLLVNPVVTTTPIATVTLDADDDGGTPPQWRDTIDAHPTRVIATCPSGSATSINATAEASGAYKEGTLSTCSATVAGAQAVADRAVSTGKSLNLTNLTIDLITAQTPLWGKVLPGLAPGAPLRVSNIPAVLFSYDTADVQVETWTYAFTIDTASVTMETTPVSTSNSGGTPTLDSFTVTGSISSQSGNTVTVAKPSGAVTGDLLVGIMTCDSTGSVAALAPPDGTWTAQGAGGTGDSGFGQVWTRAVGATEPTTYDFTVGGTTGSAVLLTDDFTGSNGASLNGAKWTAAETRTGATRQIQSNSARLDPGSNTGYNGRVSMKAAISDKADVDLLLSVKVANLDTFPQLVLRGDSGVLGQNGYEFRPGVGSSGSRLAKVSSYTPTIFGYIPGQIAANTWYKVRFQAVGTTIRAKIWLATDTEPVSWGISVTDSTHTAAGPIGIANGGGNVVGSYSYFDDVVISDPNAVTAIPEAKVTLLRVAGADTADPVLVAPSWTNNGSSTTSHDAAGLTIPSGGGLLVDHWHILTAGGGSGGGSGGSASAFSFGMSGLDSAADVTNATTWLTSHNLKAIGHWTDDTVASQQGAFGIASGGKFGAWTGILDVAVGGIFDQAHGGDVGGDTWAKAAAGNYDARWTTALNAIKTAWGARSPGNLHLRFAHEWNGSFSPWAVTNATVASFKTAFQRFANLAHSIIPGVQVVWSPNDGTSSLTHVDDGYPGSTYVDVIGPDSYNAWPHVNTLAAWNSKINGVDGNGNPVGIESWRQYALTKGKPLALPEFGNPAVDLGGAGGGDAPFYAEAILAWFKNNGGFGAGQVKYACYFNIGTVGGYPPDYLIWASGSNGTVHQPLTAAAFRDGV
jgi:LysM repeat protein